MLQAIGGLLTKSSNPDNFNVIKRVKEGGGPIDLKPFSKNKEFLNFVPPQTQKKEQEIHHQPSNIELGTSSENMIQKIKTQPKLTGINQQPIKTVIEQEKEAVQKKPGSYGNFYAMLIHDIFKIEVFHVFLGQKASKETVNNDFNQITFSTNSIGTACCCSNEGCQQ